MIPRSPRIGVWSLGLPGWFVLVDHQLNRQLLVGVRQQEGERQQKHQQQQSQLLHQLNPWRNNFRRLKQGKKQAKRRVSITNDASKTSSSSTNLFNNLVKPFTSVGADPFYGQTSGPRPPKFLQTDPILDVESRLPKIFEEKIHEKNFLIFLLIFF
jgi:hypothetical protein